MKIPFDFIYLASSLTDSCCTSGSPPVKLTLYVLFCRFLSIRLHASDIEYSLPESDGSASGVSQ